MPVNLHYEIITAFQRWKPTCAAGGVGEAGEASSTSEACISSEPGAPCGSSGASDPCVSSAASEASRARDSSKACSSQFGVKSHVLNAWDGGFVILIAIFA